MEEGCIAKLIKANDRTLADQDIRLIGADGEQVGIVTYDKARQMAKDADLDLVLVATNAKPLVCRIMDFGKLVYEQKKKIRDQRRQQHTHKLKEVKFRVNIDQHDYDYKINHAIAFIEKGYKVKCTLMFRGREMAHKDIGFEMINRVIADLETYGAPDNQAKLLGRNISVTFSPLKGHQHHS